MSPSFRIHHGLAVAYLASCVPLVHAYQFEFDFYNVHDRWGMSDYDHIGAAVDHVYPTLTVQKINEVANVAYPNVTLTMQGFGPNGDRIDLADRWDGIGVYSGLGDIGEINSNAFCTPCQGLRWSFSHLGHLSSLTMSQWDTEWGPLRDEATLSWWTPDNQEHRLALHDLPSTNSGKLKYFSFAGGGLYGTRFELQTQGWFTSTRLAGLYFTPDVLPPPPPIPTPEPTPQTPIDDPIWVPIPDNPDLPPIDTPILAVPEPEQYALIFTGLVTVGLLRSRRAWTQTRS